MLRLYVIDHTLFVLVKAAGIGERKLFLAIHLHNNYALSFFFVVLKITRVIERTNYFSACCKRANNRNITPPEDECSC